MSRWLAFGATIAAVAAPAAAHADFTSGDQLRGFIEFSAAATNGERSWIDEGFGKARFGGEDGDSDGAARAMLIWRPHLTWSLDGFISLQAQSQFHPQGDAVEAYLSYRGGPSDGWRFSGRAGLFYPPVSLEHDGVGWTTTNTITPSALNSWIGEEVKVAGVEATARRNIGGQHLSATLALFGYNDTSGTLLYARGWAMGDVLAGASTKLPLPDHPGGYQEFTRATAELDGRVGYYARLEYQPVGTMTFDVLHYDNAGDRVSDTSALTDWETSFTNVGFRAALGPDTHVLAQTMWGQTLWGQSSPLGYWGDVDFSASYVMLTHELDDSQAVAGRIDVFSTHDNSALDPDDDGEDGWALTADYRRALSDKITLAIEALHVESDRPERATIGEDPKQDQTVLQSTLHVGF